VLYDSFTPDVVDSLYSKSFQYSTKDTERVQTFTPFTYGQ